MDPTHDLPQNLDDNRQGNEPTKVELTVAKTSPTSMLIRLPSVSQLAEILGIFEIPLAHDSVVSLNAKLDQLGNRFDEGARDLSSFLREIQSEGKLVTLQIVGSHSKSGEGKIYSHFAWEIEDDGESPSFWFDLDEGIPALQLDWNKIQGDYGARAWRDIGRILKVMELPPLGTVVYGVFEDGQFNVELTSDVSVYVDSKAVSSGDLAFPMKSIWVPIGIICNNPTPSFLKMMFRELEIDLKTQLGLGNLNTLLESLQDYDSPFPASALDSLLTMPQFWNT